MTTNETAMQSINRRVDAQERSALEAASWSAVCKLARPSTIWKPVITKDGDQWCALYGENIQEGIAGFGKTPDAACRQFDIQWLNAVAS